MNGINLTNLIKARGLRSQTSVAKAIGVSRQQVWNYENGVSAPPLDMLIRLANLYGITVQDLVEQNNSVADANIT